MTATRRDERIAALIDHDGYEGYGFYWGVVEVVAEQVPPGSNKFEVGYSPKRWGQLLGCHHNKAEKYLRTLGVHGLVTFKSVNGLLWVGVPNLLKYRDEYSKKSRHAPKSVRSDSPSETETETETETERDSETKNLSVLGHVRNGQGGQLAHCTFPVTRNGRHHECGAMPASDSALCVLHRDLMAKINANEVVSS